ncbi:MAG TPA: UDP-N-acetylmuramoyl-tripeptide--D-alanyl-D-alanine ligase [Acidimicrobiales bacterium]|nr:UDP-N-acetylmuramoyl-tripeptide--D-alanyl-D-alanine ligase [Acidimicrobiales bacterium]
MLAATSGRLVEPGADGTESWTSVAIDSRLVQPGALFVPIHGQRDGHAFIGDAVARGATGYLTEEGHPRPEGAGSAAAIEVADTGQALLDVGRAARDRLAGPVVGITGSVGKTSTKDLLAAALGRRFVVTASTKSFNNELGLPLTLANGDPGTEVAVLEMGASGPGHIALLCDVGRPTVGIVTAVAAVHTELFGSIEGVAKGKSELVAALPESGTAVLNADDPRVAAMAGRTSARVLRYSPSGSTADGSTADVVASGVEVDAELRASFVLASPWGEAKLRLGARGAHQVGNALAAATAALGLGVSLDDITAALADAAISPWRMEMHHTAGGGTVVNDAYNANPASMAAALRSLATLPARRRVAVVGEMAELGTLTDEEHRSVAALAEELGVRLVAYRTDRYGVDPVDSFEAAVEAVGPLGDGDAVLVKASRVVGLERLVPLLAE